MKRLTFNKKLFVRHAEKDFKDDGTSFRFYFYKDVLPISVATWRGVRFVAIRLDYVGILEDKEDYKIVDMFNGVDEVDMNKLIKNCEYIIEKYL